jgi:hypothetical protein
VAFLTNLTIVFTDLHQGINDTVLWYRGDRINKGLLHYVAIDCKHGSSCEIQNAACSKTRIMMELHVVKGLVEEHLVLEKDDNNKLVHPSRIQNSRTRDPCQQQAGS